VIAVAGGKGGSGKTTTTLGLARALSRQGAPSSPPMPTGISRISRGWRARPTGIASPLRTRRLWSTRFGLKDRSVPIGGRQRCFRRQTSPQTSMRDESSARSQSRFPTIRRPSLTARRGVARRRSAAPGRRSVSPRDAPSAGRATRRREDRGPRASAGLSPGRRRCRSSRVGSDRSR